MVTDQVRRRFCSEFQIKILEAREHDICRLPELTSKYSNDSRSVCKLSLTATEFNVTQAPVKCVHRMGRRNINPEFHYIIPAFRDDHHH